MADVIAEVSSYKINIGGYFGRDYDYAMDMLWLTDM